MNSIGAGECLKLRLETSGSPNFVAGDFNLRHPILESFTASTSHMTMTLIDLEREKDLSLLKLTDVSSHNRCRTLDLAFCSLAGPECEIPLHLHTISDYEILVTTISLNSELNSDKIGRLEYDSLDKDLLLKFMGEKQEFSSI